MVTINKAIEMYDRINRIVSHADLINNISSPVLNSIPDLAHLNLITQNTLMGQMQHFIDVEASLSNTFDNPMIRQMQNISSMMQPVLTTSHIANAMSRNDYFLNSFNNLLVNLEREMPNFTTDINIDLEVVKGEINKPKEIDMRHILAILIFILEIALSCITNMSTQKQLERHHQEQMVLQEKQIELQENILEVLYQLQDEQQDSCSLKTDKTNLD